MGGRARRTKRQPRYFAAQLTLQQNTSIQDSLNKGNTKFNMLSFQTTKKNVHLEQPRGKTLAEPSLHELSIKYRNSSMYDHTRQSSTAWLGGVFPHLGVEHGDVAPVQVVTVEAVLRVGGISGIVELNKKKRQHQRTTNAPTSGEG